MPFCTSCGADVAADKKFCVHCGAPMEPAAAPNVPVIPAGPSVPVHPSSLAATPPLQPKKPRTTLIIGGIIVLLLVTAAVYVVGLPMLTKEQKISLGLAPSPTPTPAITYTMRPTALPTPVYTIPETTLPPTPTPPIQLRDERFEEDYEQIYTLNQQFTNGQKVSFAHDLTRTPLIIKFNLTPTTIVRHRLVSIGTNNEHFENTTETSPYAWFEVKVLDAASGVAIDQQGFGKEYSDVSQQRFLVRKQGNYLIEMSGNEVVADVQMLIGTP